MVGSCEKNISEALETYTKCGLKGLSGIGNDVRELEKSVDPKARFALEYFVYRAGLFAGMLAAALGGRDGFVFTAGSAKTPSRCAPASMRSSRGSVLRSTLTAFHRVARRQQTGYR